MESRYYSVNRDKVYVGELVIANCDLLNDELLARDSSDSSKLILSAYTPLRSMIFEPDRDYSVPKYFGCVSHDLLYGSPGYPILNITDDDYCKSLGEEAFIIHKATLLDPLLERLGYEKELSYKDIRRIRKTIFDGMFAIQHNGLFTEDKELEDIPQILRYSTDEPLSMDLYQALIDLGDRSLFEVLLKMAPRMNAFKPAKEEGCVRRLSRF